MIDFLGDFLRGRLDAVLVLLLAWLGQRSWRAFRLRRARKFWNPFVADSTQIVLGGFEREFDAFEPGGLIGISDAMAVAELERLYKKLGFSTPRVVFANRLDPESLGQNLILIGGTDSNSKTALVYGRLATTLKFGDPSRHVVSVFDSQEDHHYAPSVLRRKFVEDMRRVGQGSRRRFWSR